MLFNICRVEFSHSLGSLMCWTVLVPKIMSAAFSPIIMDGALVFPDTMLGMMEASATRKF